MRQFFLFVLTLFSLSAEVPTVIVSVAPHKYFVKAIAGDTVEVMQIVPNSASPHTYEPTPSQILKASKAKAWFRVGEGFEKKAIETLKIHNPQFNAVDLRKNLPLIPTPHAHTHGKCCSGDGADLHIWLSLRMAEIEAKTIAETLENLVPENRALYEANLKTFIEKLHDLDAKITRLFQNDKGKTFLVTHPAYAYFCRDYDLRQLSIEFEGKEPTPQAMNTMLEKAKSLKIRTVFTQAQYSTKGAKLIAELLHASTVELDPYAEDYLANMKQMALAIKKSFADSEG